MLTLFQKLLVLPLVLSVLEVSAIEISSYARVSKNGESINSSRRDNKNISQIAEVSDNIDILKFAPKKIETVAKSKKSEANNKNAREELSEGRAIQSNYNFPTLSQLMRQPVRSNSYNNEKSGRLIVYPSYNHPVGNSIDPTKRFYPGKQTAQRRFQYTPDAIHPFKSQGYQYAMPPAPSLPPPQPPAAFKAPIVVPDSPPPISSYLPPDMMPGSHFLPTISPEDSTPSQPLHLDLLTFPKHVNSSFMPYELDAIKASIDNNNHEPMPDREDSHEDETTYTPPTNLHNFPPNIDSSYLPPAKTNMESPSNSYIPPPSGENQESSQDDDSQSEEEMSKMLFNFPPNINAAYLPPGNTAKGKSPINSYLPPPSGDNSDDQELPEIGTKYIPPKNLYNFAPNIDAAYLPPANTAQGKSPINSYLPPPSGDNSDDQELPEIGTKYIPPKNLYNFPPNIDVAYLPPDMMKALLSNSYLPPPSGIPNDAPNDIDDINQDDENPNLPQIPNNYPPPASSGGSMVNKPPPGYNYFPPTNLPSSPNVQSLYLPPEIKQVMPNVNSYFQRPKGSVTGFDDGSKQQNFPGPKPMLMQMPPEMMGMPPSSSGMDMAPPPSGMDIGPPPPDHDHHHHHHDAPSWYGGDVIYDDSFNHDHHHHHDEPPPPPPTTTTEAPEEPRVKKYSYYYLGRKLWYIPLYFTLWFCLYVAALIVRSIGRHKVDLPNHYVSRSLHDMSTEELKEKIDHMTVFAMQQIEGFKEKYL